MCRGMDQHSWKYHCHSISLLTWRWDWGRWLHNWHSTPSSMHVHTPSMQMHWGTHLLHPLSERGRDKDRSRDVCMGENSIVILSLCSCTFSFAWRWGQGWMTTHCRSISPSMQVQPPMQAHWCAVLTPPPQKEVRPR